MDDKLIGETEFAIAQAKLASVHIRGRRIFKPISRERLSSLVGFWREHEFLFVKDALTDAAISLLMENISFNQMQAAHDSRQFFRIHNDRPCEAFIREFLAASNAWYASVLQTDILPAYGFAMKYIKNSDMDPHYDNFNNPISSTVCYHFSPSHLSNPIYLDRARFENPYTHRLTIKDRDGIPAQNVAEMHLGPGDIAIFRGRNHLHWRKFVEDDMDYRAVLLHFYDYKYKGQIIRAGDDIPSIENRLLDFESYEEFRRKFVMYFNSSDKPWI